MKVTIIAEDCIGCGLCVEMCPAVFELIDGVAVVISGSQCDEIPCCRGAADNCPTEAIKIA